MAINTVSVHESVQAKWEPRWTAPMRAGGVNIALTVAILSVLLRGQP